MEMFGTGMHDMLPSKEERPVPVSRAVYLCCHIIWFVSLAAIPVFLIVQKGSGVYFVIMFVITLMLGVLSGSLLSRKSRFSLAHHGKFSTAVFVVMIAAFAIAALSLAVTFIYGGAPEIVDNGYCIVDHNQVIRTITEREYRFLCIIEQLIFVSGICGLTSSSLIFARNNYKGKED